MTTTTTLTSVALGLALAGIAATLTYVVGTWALRSVLSLALAI